MDQDYSHLARQDHAEYGAALMHEAEGGQKSCGTVTTPWPLGVSYSASKINLVRPEMAFLREKFAKNGKERFTISSSFFGKRCVYVFFDVKGTFLRCHGVLCFSKVHDFHHFSPLLSYSPPLSLSVFPSIVSSLLLSLRFLLWSFLDLFLLVLMLVLVCVWRC